MFLKLILAFVVGLAVMAAVKDGRLLQRAGLTGACERVPAAVGQPPGLYECSEGRLTGRPGMSHRNCTSQGVVGTTELWLCPASPSAELLTG